MIKRNKCTRNNFRLVVELVSKVKDNKYWDGQVVRDERRMIPVSTEEDAPIGEKDDKENPTVLNRLVHHKRRD
jgi:hypothetical protein